MPPRDDDFSAGAKLLRDSSPISVWFARFDAGFQISTAAFCGVLLKKALI
jgi:hypothetical protein